MTGFSSARWQAGARLAAFARHGDAVMVLDAAGFDTFWSKRLARVSRKWKSPKGADHSCGRGAGVGRRSTSYQGGLLEIADVFAIIRATTPRRTRQREPQDELDIANRPYVWKPPIVKTVATTGEGVAELVAQIQKHRAFLEESGQLGQRHALRAEEEFFRIVRRELFNRLKAATGSGYDEASAALPRAKLTPIRRQKN